MSQSPADTVAAANAFGLCCYCEKHGATTFAVMAIDVPTPHTESGEFRISLCRRHLDAMVEQLVTTKQYLDGGTGPKIIIPEKRTKRGDLGAQAVLIGRKIDA